VPNVAVQRFLTMKCVQLRNKLGREVEEAPSFEMP